MWLHTKYESKYNPVFWLPTGAYHKNLVIWKKKIPFEMW
jgi:hypothetical protein